MHVSERERESLEVPKKITTGLSHPSKTFSIPKTYPLFECVKSSLQRRVLAGPKNCGVIPSAAMEPRKRQGIVLFLFFVHDLRFLVVKQFSRYG